MNKIFLTLATVVFIFLACGNNRKKDNSPSNDSIISPVQSVGNIPKPIVNIYIENSGSMDGYVAGVTEFEQAVYNYLTDIRISGFADSLNLFYINSIVIPQGSDVEDFIQRLEPSTFRARGGNRGTSDIANVLESVLSETKENDVAILVTDGIFSPGIGRDASEYLVNQQIGIKRTMADYLQVYPNTALLLYQLSSQFNGYYYNREDAATRINSKRPFYIWIIGHDNHLRNLLQQVPESKFKGSGIQNAFSITSGNRQVDYAVKMGSGKFDLDKKSPKTTIKNLKKDTRGKQNIARFSVNASLSGFLLNDDYIQNEDHWDYNKDFDFTINKAVSNSFGYTHQLNFSSDNVHKGIVSVKLKSEIPKWVEEVNDDDGSVPLEGKTYGIKYQIHGIYEAFTFSNNFYTELKININ